MELRGFVMKGELGNKGQRRMMNHEYETSQIKLGTVKETKEEQLKHLFTVKCKSTGGRSTTLASWVNNASN
ncbi:XRE family transcriptional regulator [Sesbania bispinosa]|nr:XRE family transcriptional regulator [Sesbania bispinosa]